MSFKLNKEFLKISGMIVIYKTIMVAGILISLSTQKPQAFASWDTFLKTTVQWDVQSYLSIAKNGYAFREANIQVYPMYPLLIRIINSVVNDYRLSALLVSNIASLVCLFLFFLLVSKDKGRDNAKSALYLFMFFPTAYFMHMSYTEPVFGAFAFAGILLLKQRQFILSAIALYCACSTRIFGLAFIPATAIYFVLNADRKNWSSKNNALMALPTLACLGAYLSYLCINKIYFGQWFYFLDHQAKHWSITASYPFYGLWTFVRQYWPQTVEHRVWCVLQAIAVIAPLIACFKSYRNKLWFELAFLASFWLVLATPSFYSAQIRYVLMAYPMYMAFAGWFSKGQHRMILYAALGVSLNITFATNFLLGRWGF